MAQDRGEGCSAAARLAGVIRMFRGVLLPRYALAGCYAATLDMPARIGAPSLRNAAAQVAETGGHEPYNRPRVRPGSARAFRAPERRCSFPHYSQRSKPKGQLPSCQRNAEFERACRSASFDNPASMANFLLSCM